MCNSLLEDNKMIRKIILLSLALSSGVLAEVCKNTPGNYTTYAGELNDGDDLCQCMQASFEKNGDLKDKTFECVETDGLDQMKWEDVRDDGTQPPCENCLGGCKRVITNNPTDSDKICEIISESAVERRKRALRLYCWLVIEIRWWRIKIYWKCRWM